MRDILARSPMFRELSADEIERMARACREIHAPKGTILFQKGDPANGFYLVVQGQLKLTFLSHTGAEKIVEIIAAGQTFGEAVMFLERPYPVYAQTLVDSLLLHVSKSAVFEEITHNRSFALKMLAGLSIRLHGLIHDVAAYSLDTATQRLIGFLLSQDLHENEKSQATIRLPAGKAVIASRLNISAETFSRMLHDLSESGLIEVQGRNITLLNPEQLRKIGL
ncbi:MAG: Crp/Fnr family transcriptional regulator [Betaproteobacteria bacterium]|nr:Crp/Fnr family transcriptional regulator [Betaproteobacteria bacterium]